MSHGKVYGHIPGVPVYATFGSRLELLEAGVHGQVQAGISGDPNENGGAYSICLSGGYEDNKDQGNKITYVGAGGQDDNGKQFRDQSFEDSHNKSLQISCITKRPVRVIRGKSDDGHYTPKEGFRYDGLYVVDKAEMRRGKKGYMMCFFELRRIEEDGVAPIPTRRTLDAKKLRKMLRATKIK